MRDDAADRVLDLREARRGFFKPGADRHARVQQDLPRVDRREEIAAEERQQQERQRDECQERRHEHAAMMQRQIKQIVIAGTKAFEASFEATLETQQRIARRRLRNVVVAMRMQQILGHGRSEEHTSELQALMRISYAVFCLKKKNT